MKTMIRRNLAPAALMLLLTAPVHAGTDIAVNGGFETGDFTGWTQFPSTSGFQEIVTINPSSGLYAARIFNNAETSASIIKNANIGIGVVAPNSSVTIQFDARGAGAVGGVAFAELFSEIDGDGVSSSEILGGAPLALTNEWQTFVFTTTTGNDVTGGITVQFAAVTGAATGSVMELFVDNLSVQVAPIPIPAAVWLFGSGLAGLLGLRRRKSAD